MSEYIKLPKGELRRAFEPIFSDITCPMHIKAEIAQILDAVEDTYAIKRGQWTPIDISYWTCDYAGIKLNPKHKYRHEECGATVKERTEYCPNCGAKMF